MPLYTRAGVPPVIPIPPKRISDEDAIILKLTKENELLKQETKNLESVISRINSALSRLDIPTYFEDGNDGDYLSTLERMDMLEGKWKRIITLNEKQ